MMDFFIKTLLNKIIGIAMEIHRELQSGFLATGLKVGLIINFGGKSLEWERIVY